MKKLLLVCSCLCLFAFSGYSQRDTVKAYPRGSLYLGINTGMAWQKADVRSRLGVGWGITLEKILTQRKTPYLGWSLRGRFLHSNTWGRDKTPFSGFGNDPAVNGTYNPDVNYTGAGYLYSNYATTMNELSLELKVFFNRAWHRSHISPYVFGGIGAMGYKTMIDQLDYDGTMYDYSDVSSTPSLAAQDLKILRDHDYESPAENVRQPHWVFTPGFGAGLAVRLGYGASLGLEHKVSLPNTDLLDGQRWTTAGLLDAKKDIHHYTNFWVNFRIFGKYVPRTVHNYREPNPIVYAPVLRIVHSEVTESCEAIIEVETQYITSSSQIRVMLNGRYLYANEFSFNRTEQKIRIRRRIEGSATFTISSTTSGGNVLETVELRCTPPIAPPPVVPNITILQPTSYPTQNCNVFIKAQLSQISSKDHIIVMKNQRPLSSQDFFFDESTGILEIRDQIQSHVDYVIKVWNAAGEKVTTVSYSCSTAPTVKTPAPEIIVLNPTTTPYVAPSCEYMLKAEIKHILRKDQIKIWVNGMLLKQWMYTYNAESRLLSLPMLLEANPMMVEIKATNESGTVSQTRVVSCNAVPPPPLEEPPVIELIDPPSPQFETDQCPYKIIAHIDNVERIDQIRILKNGQYVPGFNWQWNAVNHTVTWYTESNINSYLIIAENNAGKTQQAVSVKCKPVQTTPTVLPPVVVITSPVATPYEAPACSYLLEAEISNVQRKDQIQVWMNNAQVSNMQYQFDALRHLLTMQVNIPANGVNIRIVATNSAGKDQKSQLLTCSPPVQIPPPVIILIDPNTPMIDALQCPYKISVKVDNVQRKDQITILQNNIAIPASSWQWDNYQHTVTWYSGDQPVNSYTITAENESGKVQKKVTINCTPEIIIPPVIPPPSVVILDPSTNPFEAPGCNYMLRAEITNIRAKNQLQIWINNVLLSANQYRFDPAMHLLNVQLSIPPAGATIRIVATNEGGMDQKEQSITCMPPVIDKKITICHYPPGNHDNPQTIEISENAWPAHQAHGDIMGACPVKEPDPVIPVEPKKITICHYPPGNHDNPQTIEIDENAWPAHQVHGDVMGTCPVKTPEPADLGFQIDNGTVVPDKQYCAEIKVIGSALKVGGNGEDLPIMIRIHLGSQQIDPFGSYSSFNAATNVNDRHTHTWRSSTSISANTPISLSAKSFMPGKTTPLYERNSSQDPVMVKVLRNNSPVPSITGFNGQADAESYLKPYISGNKIVLNENQAIYLFELGTNSTSSSAYDLQDCVIIVSLKEDCNFSGNTDPVRYAPDPTPVPVEPKKITICHYPPGNHDNPQTIEISENAWPAHKAHGDGMGTCPVRTPEPVEPKEEPKKITICHYPPGNHDNPQTIEISENAWPAHQAHGDVMGACPVRNSPPNENKERDDNGNSQPNQPEKKNEENNNLWKEKENNRDDRNQNNQNNGPVNRERMSRPGR